MTEMNTEFLKALEASTPQSIARRVRRRLPDIEAALALGFTHRQIRAQLECEGIVLTEAYYQRLIPRLRSQARKGAGTAPSTQADSTHVGPSQGPAVPSPGSQNHSGPPMAMPVAKATDLSDGLAGNAVARPRTISPKPPEKKKFVWDPHGANKIDPNNF